MSPSSPNTDDKQQFSGEGSTCVFTFTYDAVNEELDIRFVERGAYRYYNVPWPTVVELEEAPSKGQYFNESIRNNYSFDRIG